MERRGGGRSTVGALLAAFIKDGTGCNLRLSISLVPTALATMAGLVVLPELLALGPTFRIGGSLVVHLRCPEGNPDAVAVELDVPENGDWDFLRCWSQEDPQALEAWGRKLVLSLNRMAAEQRDRVEVWMPEQGSPAEARR